MISIFAIFSDYALLALRLAMGSILLAHGVPKAKQFRGTAAWFGSAGFRPGIFWASIVVLVEIAGGIAIVLGIALKAATLLAALQFVVITAWKLFRREKFIGSVELDVIILAAALVLLAVGGGIYSLDRWILSGVW